MAAVCTRFWSKGSSVPTMAEPRGSSPRKDPRVLGSAYFSRIFVDPRNPDVLYVAQTSLYRSTDGGHTFEAYVGAPSGDDFHVLWIDPQNSARMILGVDQGAIISVDAGKSWSSWYNQPTGQFYHVSTDNAFPYRVYAAQQDSGTAGVLSRSDYGEILAQDWFSIGGFEYAFITPDPLNPNWVYSGGWYGSVVRFDKATGQLATVFERGEKYRTASMPPLVFSPQDPSTLYLGTQFVLKTSDRGLSWQAISPDLTGYKEKEEEEAKRDPDKPHPPAITTLSPSEVQPGVMWAGTSNRIVQLTRDAGATWQNVSPPGLTEPTEILAVEASHHDAATAYVAVGATRYSTPPYVVRTHDYGRTWQKIVNGFPEREMVRVVREDPKAQRAAVCRNRYRRLRFVGRRRPLAISATQSAGDAGDRSPGACQRSGHLNLRTRLVDSRRRHAAARHQPADRCQRCLPVSSGHRSARAMGQLSGHALSRGNSRWAEPARRSHPRLLPEVGAGRRNNADDLRRQGRRGCSILQHAKPPDLPPANVPITGLRPRWLCPKRRA